MKRFHPRILLVVRRFRPPMSLVMERFRQRIPLVTTKRGQQSLRQKCALFTINQAVDIGFGIHLETEQLHTAKQGKVVAVVGSSAELHVHLDGEVPNKVQSLFYRVIGLQKKHFLIFEKNPYIIR